MTRDEALARLRPLEAELRSGGIAALYLFGSTARNEASDESDVDLLFELGSVARFSFSDFFAVQDRLASVLGRDVDLVPRKTLRPAILDRASREMAQVF